MTKSFIVILGSILALGFSFACWIHVLQSLVPFTHWVPGLLFGHRGSTELVDMD